MSSASYGATTCKKYHMYATNDSKAQGSVSRNRSLLDKHNRLIEVCIVSKIHAEPANNNPVTG